MTKMVLESGFISEADDRSKLTRLLPTLTIPGTLHDSLIARLDRLNTAKTVAQLGAAIGRQFSYEFLRAVWPMDEATLQQALGQLVETELLYQRGLPPQATYVFKHALIQEAAYQSLLKSMRQQYHQQIAQMLAKRFPETVETQPELLAHHHTEAGLAAQAVSYWQRAGQRAIERSANVEAIARIGCLRPAGASLPGISLRTGSWGSVPRLCGLALGMLGYPDQVLQRSRATLTLPQELSHSFSLAYALDFAARIHQVRREAQLTQAQAQALIALSREQGFAQRLATGTILWGWALTAQGQGAEGTAQIRQGLAAFRATGAELAQPYYLALLGEAYGELEQAGEGLKVLAEALATIHKTGEQEA
jgi:hypothetical protein